MTQASRDTPLLSGLVGLIVSCGGGLAPPTDLPSPSEACQAQPVTQLAVGQHVILNPASTDGCLRLPQAGAAGAEYLLVLASTNGTKTTSGIRGTYLLHSSSPIATTAPLAPRVGSSRGSAGARFDAALRVLEQELAMDPRNLPGPAPAPGVIQAPPLGDIRSFKVCGNLTCSSFNTIQATARYVGEHAAVYMDNDVPQSDPLQTSDLEELGTAFDNRHYPIDTTAFGRESDIDGNGVVLILMTDAVNALTPDCTDGRVIGYFFGGDLLTGANSNRAEIFYTLVPAPATSTCKVVTRAGALGNLKPTLIHEFQHMISYNQHVLIRGGSSEEVWLNEALSHFAEELGGRRIPDSECSVSGFSSCRSQYTTGDIVDAYEYFEDTEAHFMVFTGSGTLPERGAVWLFLRWTLDHFAADTVLGTATTRALLATNLTGVVNLTTVTGGNFSEMVPRWLMSVYLDDGPDLPVEPTGLLRLKTWGLRSIWTDPRNQTTATPPGPFSGFPLVPLQVDAGFTREGNLKAGSGRHFLIEQQSGGAAVDLQALKSSAGTQLDPTLQARFGIVRIR